MKVLRVTSLFLGLVCISAGKQASSPRTIDTLNADEAKFNMQTQGVIEILGEPYKCIERLGVK